MRKDTMVKTPTIPIELSGKASISLDVMALLDSGADLSVIPEGIAKVLNLDLSGKIEKANGIGGSVNVINTKMTARVKQKRESYQFIIPVQVILGKDKIPPLLGRKGFFDKFEITFLDRQQKVKLKRILPTKY